MTELLEQVERHIIGQRLCRAGQPILVAVSGGVDSMVLLHLLHSLLPKFHWELVVAHFNHGLRGRSSDADERLVRRVASKLRVPFVSGREDVRTFARAHRVSIEMAARQLRHEFLARTARANRIRTIALAHHADDQVELFFLRLLRGTGLEGLGGMPWSGSSPVDPKLTLIRPLLDQTKAELEAFATAHKVTFRLDASNRDLDLQRNRLRHELLPLLEKQYQPALGRIVPRLMTLLRDENHVVESLLSKLSSPGSGNFSDLPVALQRRLLHDRILESGLVPDFDAIEHLRLKPNNPITIAPALQATGKNLALPLLPGAVKVSRDAHGQLIRETCEGVRRSFDSNRVEINVTGQRSVTFGGLCLKLGHLSGPKLKRALQGLNASAASRGSSDHKPKLLAGSELYDLETIGDKVILRHWQPGDRFRPIGMKSAVKLQDCFTNAKVPRDQRHRRVVATTALGEIFWVEGLRIAERFKLSGQTKRGLLWHWQRA